VNTSSYDYKTKCIKTQAVPITPIGPEVPPSLTRYPLYNNTEKPRSCIVIGCETCTIEYRNDGDITEEC